ncbi:NUDIX hydrolase [Flavobacterium sp. RNTU_13]|uniref:NUDIX hydrolase n=1 Tax=Flavobacterium sp. RNTU_13 TaxID=3375145 RepID=UPI003985B3B0
MLFSDFTNIYLPKIKNQVLPGLNAHVLMAPEGRRPSLTPEYYTAQNPRASAVMMLIYPRQEDATLVLTQRHTYVGVHSAQVSFPGGKAEVTDATLTYTALRETFEEVGIKPEEITIVQGFTPLYIPPSNFLVSPFLGVMEYEPEFIPAEAEVAEIIELPLSLLVDDSIVQSVSLETSYAPLSKVPAFNVHGKIVWGATAMMLSELKEVLKKVL